MAKFGCEVTVRKYNAQKGKTVGFADLKFLDGKEEVFVVKGITIVDGANGLFISMPQQKNSKGEYKDICFPLTADFRKDLQETIVEEFNKL